MILFIKNNYNLVHIINFCQFYLYKIKIYIFITNNTFRKLNIDFNFYEL